ncbi:uncharacterized protein LOC143019670 [Oratosquilla oratoria]|uniref:uncharacterized protein LOC143019670 n=1 Tax=Oratosquilla oratoria TaxID=337810 RepID=UPI003F770A66
MESNPGVTLGYPGTGYSEAGYGFILDYVPSSSLTLEVPPIIGRKICRLFGLSPISKRTSQTLRSQPWVLHLPDLQKSLHYDYRNSHHPKPRLLKPLACTPQPPVLQPKPLQPPLRLRRP